MVNTLALVVAASAIHSNDHRRAVVSGSADIGPSWHSDLTMLNRVLICRDKAVVGAVGGRYQAGY
ncbi:methylase [Mycolicibacterium novocastrense]|uniref:Methylase n=1 Tax=Mycolicibacterium novocastrense TaxID=59813 RepID=A0ABQ0KKR0_MYCNV|nr:methylase [Mycolicibacterium novocastrense]